MSQTRAGSMIEALANVAIGYSVSVTANAIILPAFGYHVTLRDNLLIGIAFTVVSIVRSYAIRRLFNRLHR